MDINTEVSIMVTSTVLVLYYGGPEVQLVTKTLTTGYSTRKMVANDSQQGPLPWQGVVLVL